MNNNADANKVIGRYREQVAGLSHQLILIETLREQDTETIEQLKQENKELKLELEISERKLATYTTTEGNSSEVIEG